MDRYENERRANFLARLDGAVPFKNGVYCGYWGTYSRILSPAGWDSDPGRIGTVVEVNLTPVNGWDTYDALQQVGGIRIRRHRTDRSKGSDAYVNRLPRYQYERMVALVGADLAQRLLYEDFMPLIDWAKYRQHDNGGCDLHLCSKGAEAPAVVAAE